MGSRPTDLEVAGSNPARCCFFYSPIQIFYIITNCIHYSTHQAKQAEKFRMRKNVKLKIHRNTEIIYFQKLLEHQTQVVEQQRDKLGRFMIRDTSTNIFTYIAKSSKVIPPSDLTFSDSFYGEIPHICT